MFAVYSWNGDNQGLNKRRHNLTIHKIM